MLFRNPLVALAVAGILFFSCDRRDFTEPYITGTGFSYPDSIIYLKAGPTDHIVYPLIGGEGYYYAHPDGMQIDPKTGAINVSKSETGLRYLVTYKDLSGKSHTSRIVLAGINYPDHYHKLKGGDSISRPVYNADVNRVLPPGNVFDENNLANTEGLAVAQSDGSINLAQTVRNGLFGSTPKNGSRLDIEVPYRINDGSHGALNSIKVRLYYYNTMADIPQSLKQLLSERESSYIRVMDPANAGRETSYAKPRPPCVIIVGE